MTLFSATHSLAAETDDFAAGASAPIVVGTKSIGSSAFRPSEPEFVSKMPRQPAASVADLSARLYRAYTIDGGQVRLAGCTLEPQPILHIEMLDDLSGDTATTNDHGDADRQTAIKVEIQSTQSV